MCLYKRLRFNHLTHFDFNVCRYFEECYPIQTLAIDLPGEGADELMGLQFVLRNEEGTTWFKDTTNGGGAHKLNPVDP
jgi:hypothetical protein